MSAKRALIVDDSRSARSFLARILEKYDIAVDTAETAEVAIEYLTKARPDVIFMDHMMPGMDGFQAVQLIKNNPATATIPIMMYTSQEGELYLGQARALGAMGVLPKQIKPADVSTVLHQLRLLPDRRQGTQSSFLPGNDVAAEATKSAPTLVPARSVTESGPAASSGSATAPAEPAVNAAPTAIDPAAIAEWRHQFELMLRTELGDLQRRLDASLEQQSDRLLADVRAVVTELNPPAPPAPPAPEPPRAPWIAAAAASAAAAAFAVMWWLEAQQTSARIAAALRPAPATRMTSPAPPAVVPTPVGAAAPDAPAPAVAGAVAGPNVAGGIASAAGGWPELTIQTVPYGEVPLAGERLEQLRALLRDVAARGFRGRIIVTSFPGRFCLAGSAAEGFGPAADDTPFERCDLLGNPQDDALTMAQREPLTLVNLIGTIRRESGGAIEVELATGSESQRAAPYPAPGPRLTAAEWNRAAALNNRVEIRLRPAG